MKELPETKKRAFRVFKFLNQNLHFHQPNIKFNKWVHPNENKSYLNITGLDEQVCLRFYGFKSDTPSYDLRVLSLLLLQGVHGTTAEKELTDGRLLLCFMDFLKNNFNEDIFMNLEGPIANPLINQLPFAYHLDSGFFRTLHEILIKLRSNDGQVSLLNYKELEKDDSGSSLHEVRSLSFDESEDDNTRSSLID